MRLVPLEVTAHKIWLRVLNDLSVAVHSGIPADKIRHRILPWE
jgi:hypothetical protein